MKFLIVSICLVGMIGTIIGITAWSGTEAVISATVTARNLSINKTQGGTIAYGTLNTSAVTTTDPSSDIYAIQGQATVEQIFQNDGSQAKFNIQTETTTGGATPWTAAAAVGVNNEYVHWFATTTAITWQMLQVNETYETASSTVDNGASLNIYLKFQAPSGSSDYAQKTVPVRVQAATP